MQASARLTYKIFAANCKCSFISSRKKTSFLAIEQKKRKSKRKQNSFNFSSGESAWIWNIFFFLLFIELSNQKDKNEWTPNPKNKKSQNIWRDEKTKEESTTTRKTENIRWPLHDCIGWLVVSCKRRYLLDIKIAKRIANVGLLH